MLITHRQLPEFNDILLETSRQRDLKAEEGGSWASSGMYGLWNKKISINVACPVRERFQSTFF